MFCACSALTWKPPRKSKAQGSLPLSRRWARFVERRSSPSAQPLHLNIQYCQPPPLRLIEILIIAYILVLCRGVESEPYRQKKNKNQKDSQETLQPACITLIINNLTLTKCVTSISAPQHYKKNGCINSINYVTCCIITRSLQLITFTLNNLTQNKMRCKHFIF